MPFFFDPVSQLLVVSVGPSVRALCIKNRDRTAVVVKHYSGHVDDVNDLLVHLHLLLTASTELINHNFGTGQERWRALGDNGKRIAKIAVLRDLVVCCFEDCSVGMVHAQKGDVLYLTNLRGERAGGVPSIIIEPISQYAFVQGNRCINAWNCRTGTREYNSDLVLGQVCRSAVQFRCMCLFCLCLGMS
jgi:hypothetical protein